MHKLDTLITGDLNAPNTNFRVNWISFALVFNFESYQV